MAYDREFIKTTFGFTVDGSDEIAMTAINWSLALPPWEGAREYLDQIVVDGPLLGETLIGRMATLMTTPSLLWASYSALRTVRFSAHGLDGAEEGSAYIVEDPTPTRGTSVTTPPQLTVVVSTRSGLTSGSANFGRMYLPHTRLPLLAGEPAAVAGEAAAVVAAADAFFEGVEDDLFAASGITRLQPHIMSNKTPVSPSKRIDQLAVGTVTDTQRRRRNQLTELYSFTTLSHA